MGFEFVAPRSIIFGNGSIEKIKAVALEFGRKALVVCGSGSVPMSKLFELLDEAAAWNRAHLSLADHLNQLYALERGVG